MPYSSPQLPDGLDRILDEAWLESRIIPGFLGENEARFLGTLAACTPGQGDIVEIGSFKGKSTVMLATVASKVRRGKVVAIDPHGGLSYLGANAPHQDPTFNEFLASLRNAGVQQFIEVHRATSMGVAKDWRRPISLLWIDGDHSYSGCKTDFDLFSPFLSEGAVIAFHDTLNAFEGPIRVFVEEILRSDRFGPAGFVHSIAWSQYRPADGGGFREHRQKLERRAARLLPYVANGASPTGLRKKAFKLNRFLIPHKLISPVEFINRVCV